MDPKLIDVNMMYLKVKDIKSPKEVLETLQKSRPEMGFGKPEEVRFLTYGVWLAKNKPTWFAYFGKLNTIMQKVNFEDINTFPTKVPKEPKGWINPLPYMRD